MLKDIEGQKGITTDGYTSDFSEQGKQAGDVSAKKSEHTILVHKEEDEVSNKDILMLTLLGIADGYAPYAPLCGIVYFTHTVYHNYSIYMQIVVTIVCTYPVVNFMQLLFDEHFDDRFGSYKTYTFRIAFNVFGIAVMAFIFPFLGGMYPKEDGSAPSSNELIIGTVAITAFSALMSGSVMQFVNFAKFPNSRGMNWVTFGQQSSGILLAVTALATSFDENAKRSNVQSFFFITGAYTLLVWFLFLYTAATSKFYETQLVAKDSERQVFINDSLLSSSEIFCTLFRAIIAMFITIVSSAALLAFYPRLASSQLAAWLLYVKFACNAASRLVARKLFLIESQTTFLVLSIARACAFSFFWLHIRGIVEMDDATIVSAIALWGFTEGLFCNFTYYFNMMIFHTKSERNRGGTILNMVVAFSLFASGLLSVFLHHLLQDDVLEEEGPDSWE